MAEGFTETETSQNYTNEETDNDEDPSLEDAPSETVDEIIAHKDINIGNWADLLEGDVPQPETEEPEEVPVIPEEKPPVVPEVYPHKLAIVLASDLTLCQMPKDPPFNVVVFQLPDGVTEEELYMLFGGRRAIESHLYRRDLREMVFTFRKQGHMIDALLKESMIFKEKPLKLAVILLANQINKYHNHNKHHVDLDLRMLPFRRAYDKCYERLEDGSLSELFDVSMADDAESVGSSSQIPPYRKSSSDVRYTQPQQGSLRQRNESITSMASTKSFSEQGPSQSVSRQSSYQPSEKDQAVFQKPRLPSQTSVESSSSPASAQKRPPFSKAQSRNPFADAKPVNTDKKVLSVQEKLMTQKSMDRQKNAPVPIPPDFNQPPPNYVRYPPPEMGPGTFKIQKRPDGIIPPQNGQMYTNSNFNTHGPAAVPFRHPGPSNVAPTAPSLPMNIGDETIDVSKPPPPIRHQETVQKPSHSTVHPKHEKKQRSYNKKGSNYQNIQNGFNPNLPKQTSSNSQNYASHQSLPPAALNRRKSSTDQRAVSEVLQAEKSQSAPASHETVAISHSPRSSPSSTSIKRPNSANSSMSFVTAHSGSEMSSTMSTDLPGIPSSIDSISERLSEIADDQRRHSWEGRNSPGRKKEFAKKKNSLGSKRGKKSAERKKHFDSDNLSRRSSASTPQYQSASNVFLDVSESSEVTEKDNQPEPVPPSEPEHRALSKAKNGLEKRAPSLPLSRPHTSSNEKTTNTPKTEPIKPETLSAPTTPVGTNNKKKAGKKDKKKPTMAVLQQNKFHALSDGFQ